MCGRGQRVQSSFGMILFRPTGVKIVIGKETASRHRYVRHADEKRMGVYVCAFFAFDRLSRGKQNERAAVTKPIVTTIVVVSNESFVLFNRKGNQAMQSNEKSQSEFLARLLQNEKHQRTSASIIATLPYR